MNIPVIARPPPAIASAAKQSPYGGTFQEVATSLTLLAMTGEALKSRLQGASTFTKIIFSLNNEFYHIE